MNGTTNTFVDESASAHAITAQGDATQLPITGRTAGFFDGNSDYLSIADSADWDFGTGDFSVEMDIMWKSRANTMFIDIGDGSGGVGTNIRYSETNDRWEIYLNSSDIFGTGLESSPNIFQWYKIKLERVGTDLDFYLDNVSLGSATNSTNISCTTPCLIGAGEGPTEFFNGWIKNVKIIKAGTTVLDLPMNPPTGLGSPISSTAWFDGNSDYLSVPDSADWDFGTGNFSVEMYIRGAALAGANRTLLGTNSEKIDLLYRDGAGIRAKLAATSYDFAWTPVINTWYKIKLTRTGTDLVCTIDGAAIGATLTAADDITGVTTVYLGANATPAEYFSGWIKNVKIVKGTTTVLDLALNGTPDDTDNTNGWLTDSSASAHTVSANGTATCKFIEDYRNRTITDISASAHVVTCVGTAKLDWISVEGSGVLKLDGTGDYLTSADSADFNLGDAGSGNFNATLWTKFISLGADRGLISTSDSGGTDGWYLNLTTNNLEFGAVGAGSSTLALTPRVNEWYFLELTRTSGTVTMFSNGSPLGTFTDRDLNNDSNPILVGAFRTGLGYTDGYIDVLTIDKGTAGHTAAYIPPKYGLGGSRGFIL